MPEATRSHTRERHTAWPRLYSAEPGRKPLCPGPRERSARDEMDENEFLGIAELAALAVPQDPEDRDAFWKARAVLRNFARRVTRMSSAPGTPPPGAARGEAVCPLRPDDPAGGLPEGAAFEIAPETGERLIQVPRIL